MNFPESLFYSFLKYNKYPLYKKTHISIISNSENIVQLLLVSTEERDQAKRALRWMQPRMD